MGDENEWVHEFHELHESCLLGENDGILTIVVHYLYVIWVVYNPTNPGFEHCSR